MINVNNNKRLNKLHIFLVKIKHQNKVLRALTSVLEHVKHIQRWIQNPVKLHKTFACLIGGFEAIPPIPPICLTKARISIVIWYWEQKLIDLNRFLCVKKSPNTEDFLVRIFLHSDWIGKYAHLTYLRHGWLEKYNLHKNLKVTNLGPMFPPINCPANIYLLRVNKKNTRTMCEICLTKLTINTPKQCHWRCSSVFIVNFEHILLIILVFLFLTLNK